MSCCSDIVRRNGPTRCPSTSTPPPMTRRPPGPFPPPPAPRSHKGEVFLSRRPFPPVDTSRLGGERGETNRSDRHGWHHLDAGRGRERRASVPPPRRPPARGSGTGARRGGGTAGVRLHPWGLHDRAEVGRPEPSGDGDAGPPGGGRGRHHPRDRHARGDGVLPLSHGRLREAGGVHGGDAQRFADRV